MIENVEAVLIGCRKVKGDGSMEKDQTKKQKKQEAPISEVYPVIDTDLARDNLENDLPAADLEDL